VVHSPLVEICRRASAAILAVLVTERYQLAAIVRDGERKEPIKFSCKDLWPRSFADAFRAAGWHSGWKIVVCRTGFRQFAIEMW